MSKSGLRAGTAQGKGLVGEESTVISENIWTGCSQAQVTWAGLVIEDAL